MGTVLVHCGGDQSVGTVQVHCGGAQSGGAERRWMIRQGDGV